MKLKISKKIIATTAAIIIIVLMFIWALSAIERNDLNMYGFKIWHLRFFNHFFVDGDNKFNWIGITSVLAILSLTFTAWDSRKKMKADIVSKSRVQWMAELRPILADYLVVTRKYFSVYAVFINSTYMIQASKGQMYENETSDHSEEYKRHAKESKLASEELLRQYERVSGLIKFYIPERPDNAKILMAIGSLNNEMENFPSEMEKVVSTYRSSIQEIRIEKIRNNKSFIDKGPIVPQKIDKMIIKKINSVQEEGRLFLKQEWEKAKRGE